MTTEENDRISQIEASKKRIVGNFQEIVRKTPDLFSEIEIQILLKLAENGHNDLFIEYFHEVFARKIEEWKRICSPKK